MSQSISTQSLRIACQQLAPQVGQSEYNRSLATEAIRDALTTGAGLVILPELVTSGYVFDSLDEARSLALTGESEIFAEWSSLAAPTDAVIIGGFPELGADGHLYNSAAIVDGSGVRAIYRKIHLWDKEKLFFSPGSQPPPIIETAFGRLSILICFDLEFPESARCLGVRGADIIAVPTNWPLFPRPEGERPPEIINAMSAARLSRVFIACCDRVGTERGVDWTGGTAIVDQDGWVIAERVNRDAGIITADVDLSLARDKAWTELCGVMKDRRPELYTALVEPIPLQ